MENKAPKVVVVSGKKNCGKTTLINRIVSTLSAQGLKVAVIKHDGHDFECDRPGTDSHSFTEAGAYGAAVFSDHRMFVHRVGTGEEEEDILGFFPDADLIIMEGFKDCPRPKIEVIRSEITDTLTSNPEGRFLVVSDMKTDKIKGRNNEPVLAFENLDQIIRMILSR